MVLWSTAKRCFFDRTWTLSRGLNDCEFCESEWVEFVVEALFIARKNRPIVKEVPIAFVNRKDGETKLKCKNVVNWAFFRGRIFFI